MKMVVYLCQDESCAAKFAVEMSAIEFIGCTPDCPACGCYETAKVGETVVKLESLDEIERLQTQLQSWIDTAMASATEARILHELAKDQDYASTLLSHYPVIEFYTLRKGKNGEQWDKVYGKKIEHDGLEFGVYFDPKIMDWHVVDLVCGMALGHVENFENAIVRVVQVVEWKGAEKFKVELIEESKKHEPRPDVPRIVPLQASEGAKGE